MSGGEGKVAGRMSGNVREHAATVVVAALSSFFASTLILGVDVMVAAMDPRLIAESGTFKVVLMMVALIFILIALYVGSIVTGNTRAGLVSHAASVTTCNDPRDFFFPFATPGTWDRVPRRNFAAFGAPWPCTFAFAASHTSGACSFDRVFFDPSTNATPPSVAVASAPVTINVVGNTTSPLLP